MGYDSGYLKEETANEYTRTAHVVTENQHSIAAEFQQMVGSIGCSAIQPAGQR